MPDNLDDNIAPRRALAGTGPAWLAYVLVFLAVLALGSGLWYILAPESMARLVGRLNPGPLAIEGLTLSIDQRQVDLPPNGAVEIHPAQRFGIVGLKSSRWRNYDLRLSSPEIDIKAVSGGALATTRDLLPDESFENTKEIHISVLDGPNVAADFRILSRYSAIDFMARGDAADSAEARVEFYRKAFQLDPSSDLIRNKLVAALGELGRDNGARAASVYENLLAQGGANEELLNRLADVYLAENKNDRLISVLERLISLRESQGQPARDYHRRLAEALADGGRLAEAASLQEQLLKEAPAGEKAAHLGELVAIYREMRDSEREIDALKRLAEAAPPDQATAIWTEIALLYEKSGDSAGRLTAWRNLAAKLPDGPAKANVHKIIGNLLAGEEKYGQAREAYQAAVKLEPGDANALVNLARLSLLDNDNAAYLANLNKAVDLAPDNIDLRRELAEALAQAKQNAKAKAQYQELVKRRPDDQNLRLIYIGFLDKIGDKNGLVEQYGVMAGLDPNNKVLPYNIGVIHFEKKDWNKAAEAFQKVLALDPKDLEAREYLLVTYQRKGQRADILREAMELYKLQPSKTVYRTLMLNTCENAKDWKGYAQVAEAVTQIEPDSPEGWRFLHKAQSQLGQKGPAAESLWHIAEKEKTKDKKIEAWSQTARAFTTLGQKDRAAQAYHKILELDPDNKRAASALAALQ